MNQPQENKMGTMPINKLIINISLPMIISMLIQAMYNVVDSIFVARISEDALTAVSLAFPFQNLMIAVGSGTGVGVNSLLSRYLGEKNFKYADKTANVSVFLGVMNFAVFAAVGMLFSRLYFNIQTDSRAISDAGVIYLRICSVMSFGIFGQFCFERLLQSTGKTICTMCSQGIGAVINIILDPCMIFGYGPFPKMGIAGAAVATITGQIVAMLIAFGLNRKLNSEIHLNIKDIFPNKEIVKKIYAVGVPSILMASIGSVMTFCLNKILAAFTSTAVAVFGVYFKLQSFIFMPIFGLNNGMVPIIAYNLGARKPDRIKKTKHLCTLYAMLLMMIGFVAFQTAPSLLLKMFNASEKMIEIGVPALRIISIHFIMAGISVVSISTFQAVGKGMYALYISVARQLFALVPVAYFMSLTGSLNAIWWSFPIAELVAVISCIAFMNRVNKTILDAIK